MDWKIKNWMENIPETSSPIPSVAPSFSPPSHTSTCLPSIAVGNMASPYSVGSQAAQFYQVVCLLIDLLQIIQPLSL
jgi:hypothetical protein